MRRKTRINWAVFLCIVFHKQKSSRYEIDSSRTIFMNIWLCGAVFCLFVFCVFLLETTLLVMDCL